MFDSSVTEIDRDESRSAARYAVEDVDIPDPAEYAECEPSEIPGWINDIDLPWLHGVDTEPPF